MDEQLWALALVTVQKTNWEKLGLREPHICPQTHTHLWLLCVPFTTDLENYQMKTLEMGRQKSSREAVALTSLLDVNFLGITLLWPCFPGHARFVQIPPELQGRHTEDVSWTRLCLCSAPSGGMSLRKATNVFVFLWVHLPNTHVCFRLSGHNIFDLRERQSYQKQQFPLHAVSEGLRH